VVPADGDIMNQLGALPKEYNSNGFVIVVEPLIGSMTVTVGSVKMLGNGASPAGMAGRSES
jgi:hypothetical protein